MYIFIASDKIHKTSNKAKSATVAIKPNKNILKIPSEFKFIFLKFSTVGNHFTLFSIYFIFGETNNLNKNQITPN